MSSNGIILTLAYPETIVMVSKEWFSPFLRFLGTLSTHEWRKIRAQRPRPIESHHNRWRNTFALVSLTPVNPARSIHFPILITSICSFLSKPSQYLPTKPTKLLGCDPLPTQFSIRLAIKGLHWVFGSRVIVLV